MSVQSCCVSCHRTPLQPLPSIRLELKVGFHKDYVRVHDGQVDRFAHQFLQTRTSENISLQGIATMKFSVTVSGMNSDTLSDRNFNLLSNINSDIPSDILLSDIHSDILLAYILTFYLTNILTFYLTYNLTFYLTYNLTFYLTYIMTYILSFYLT